MEQATATADFINREFVFQHKLEGQKGGVAISISQIFPVKNNHENCRRISQKNIV